MKIINYEFLLVIVMMMLLMTILPAFPRAALAFPLRVLFICTIIVVFLFAVAMILDKHFLFFFCFFFKTINTMETNGSNRKWSLVIFDDEIMIIIDRLKSENEYNLRNILFGWKLLYIFCLLLVFEIFYFLPSVFFYFFFLKYTTFHFRPLCFSFSFFFWQFPLIFCYCCWSFAFKGKI